MTAINEKSLEKLRLFSVLKYSFNIYHNPCIFAYNASVVMKPLSCLYFITLLCYSLHAFGQTEDTIGSQVWSSVNLNVTIFRNGDKIPEAETNDEWNKASKEGTPSWCYYNKDSINGSKYGKLYNWYAVNDKRGLAPKGWHIPSDKEWGTLVNYLRGDTTTEKEDTSIGYKIKSMTGWEYYGNGINSCGFSALPGGLRLEGPFYELGKSATFWSSTDDNGSFFLWSRFLVYYSHHLYREKTNEGYGYS